MLYTRDKEIINKLIEHSKGNYKRFTQGDIEYIIYTIKKCSKIENNKDQNLFWHDLQAV